ERGRPRRADVVDAEAFVADGDVRVVAVERDRGRLHGGRREDDRALRIAEVLDDEPALRAREVRDGSLHDGAAEPVVAVALGREEGDVAGLAEIDRGDAV